MQLSEAYRTTACSTSRRAKTAYPRDRLSISGLRYYSPTLSRWLSRDPLGEESFLNSIRENLVQERKDAIRRKLGVSGVFAASQYSLQDGMDVYLDAYLTKLAERDIVISVLLETRNLYHFVYNQPMSRVDPTGLGRYFPIGGKLCADKCCTQEKLNQQLRTLPEKKGSWENKPNPWEQGKLKPGKCIGTDGMATPAGRLHIRDNCTCYIKCDKDGNIESNVACYCNRLFPQEPVWEPPYFPPNPFNPVPTQ